MRRKLVGFIVANPEAVYQQRVMDGLLSQCRRYGYDCAVFTPLVQTCHFYKEYLDGEVNIYNLINFDKLDGVIVATISLTENNTTEVRDMVEALLKEKCRKPVISLDMPLGDYPMVHTDDRSAFSVITAHLMDVHNCSKIYFLTGMKGHAVSEQRVGGFEDMLKKRGMELDPDNVFYGDFWYTGGEALADKIANGEVERPEAVICASDHMAIGLANRLADRGFKIPEDIIVTGYDATSESAINDITITSYQPEISKAAAEAVNMIRREIEPGAEILAPEKGETGLKICSSCGCPENLGYIKQRLSSSLYNVNHNHGDPEVMQSMDISRLLDSYMFENFTASESVEDCLKKINGSAYLIKPFYRYYLCLEENWLDADMCTEKGYPEVMKNVIRSVDAVCDEDYKKSYIGDGHGHEFETALMLPELYDEERENPCVFYFVPMHFKTNTMGYSVLQCDIAQKNRIGIVFRNWIRNVNNALEMIRVQNRLMAFSERDAMTGLYNRRGMERKVKEMAAHATVRDSWLVFVIDMDGLKFINDTYGHSEGDYGISAVAAASGQIARSSEICVRAGGDEFYIIGLGEYNYIDAIVRIEKFNEALAEENKAEKPFEISASIGFCCEAFSSGCGIDDIIRLADGRMYESKVERKKARK
ncbi:MAG: GGDEF domain-containing protein [Oscillospiraceae bacterium]|nr:GGDEF domain-containing protein [Oscillospiraceae bacterium]